MHARSGGLLALILFASCGCAAAPASDERPGRRPELALMTTLPIYWGQGGDVRSVLAGESPPGWVRPALEQRFTVVPLDTLEAANLEKHRHLVLAQPRPLDPAENVALDRWVRGGGRLLLFADPLLTAHSPYPIGDRRRAQDVVLLSPILRHWGLELTLDEGEESGERWLALRGGARLPVDVPGRLQPLGTGGECVFDAGQVIAECPLGRGRVVVVADAHLVSESEAEAGSATERASTLSTLLDRAFD